MSANNLNTSNIGELSKTPSLGRNLLALIKKSASSSLQKAVGWRLEIRRHDNMDEFQTKLRFNENWNVKKSRKFYVILYKRWLCICWIYKISLCLLKVDTRSYIKQAKKALSGYSWLQIFMKIWRETPYIKSGQVVKLLVKFQILPIWINPKNLKSVFWHYQK